MRLFAEAFAVGIPRYSDILYQYPPGSVFYVEPWTNLTMTLGTVPSDDVAPRGQNSHSVGVTPVVRPPVLYSPIPTTPAVALDLALLVPENIAAARVEDVLRRGAAELLERLELLDEYRGKGIEPGTRSLMWRLTLRHAERTLRDKEVEGRRDKLLKTLENELGIRQRTA